MRALVTLLFLAACTADVDPLTVEDTFELGANPAVDILFVVDDSNSMAGIQAGVGAGWASLVGGLGAADWQVGVTTTDFDDPARRGRLRFVEGEDRVLDASNTTPNVRFASAIGAGLEGSQTERGLQAAWAAVTPPLATHENEGLIRAEARLAIVIVSDEDDCSDEGALGEGPSTDCQTRPELLVPSDELGARFLGLKDGLGDVTVHAVVESGDIETGCGLANPGTRYVDVAERTGGLVLPPCGDFGASLAALGAEMSGFRRAYPLSRTASVLTIRVVVDSESAGATTLTEDPTGAAGWSYDDDANVLSLGADVALPGDSIVRISYAVPTS